MHAINFLARMVVYGIKRIDILNQNTARTSDE